MSVITTLFDALRRNRIEHRGLQDDFQAALRAYVSKRYPRMEETRSYAVVRGDMILFTFACTDHTNDQCILDEMAIELDAAINDETIIIQAQDIE